MTRRLMVDIKSGDRLMVIDEWKIYVDTIIDIVNWIINYDSLCLQDKAYTVYNNTTQYDSYMGFLRDRRIHIWYALE